MPRKRTARFWKKETKEAGTERTKKRWGGGTTGKVVFDPAKSRERIHPKTPRQIGAGTKGEKGHSKSDLGASLVHSVEEEELAKEMGGTQGPKKERIEKNRAATSGYTKGNPRGESRKERSSSQTKRRSPKTQEEREQKEKKEVVKQKIRGGTPSQPAHPSASGRRKFQKAERETPQ